MGPSTLKRVSLEFVQIALMNLALRVVSLEFANLVSQKDNMLKKKKEKTLSWYKKELDKWFSRYIRERDRHVCYTCNLQMEPNRSQCGHFVPRQYLATRFDEINCHAQCYACNMLYNGQPSRYAQRLRQDFGDEIIDRLENSRRQITKLDITWYVEKIEYYKQKKPL